MSIDPISIRPSGERRNAPQGVTLTDLVVDTFDGNVTVKCDSDEAVTPIGQLPFFIEFLKPGHLFEPWVDGCPLNYTRNIAPHKVDILGLENSRGGQQSFGFIDNGEGVNLFEYAVLVTSLRNEVLSIVHHYRDRADCENNFDEIKNHWGWGEFPTRDSEFCRLILGEAMSKFLGDRGLGSFDEALLSG